MSHNQGHAEWSSGKIEDFRVRNLAFGLGFANNRELAFPSKKFLFSRSLWWALIKYKTPLRLQRWLKSCFDVKLSLSVCYLSSVLCVYSVKRKAECWHCRECKEGKVTSFRLYLSVLLHLPLVRKYMEDLKSFLFFCFFLHTNTLLTKYTQTIKK